MIYTLKNLLKSTYDILFPAFCFECQNILRTNEIVMCKSCYESLKKVNSTHIHSFLKRLPQIHMDDLIILFDFSESLQKMMHLFKYDGHIKIANYFADSLADKIIQEYDLICSVPMHKTKFRERGYNQSALIASNLAAGMNLRFGENILIRKTYNKSQTRLSRLQRAENISGAFNVNGNVKGARILLIDDVITTGSTINECARVLKIAGAACADAAAIATPLNILETD